MRKQRKKKYKQIKDNNSVLEGTVLLAHFLTRSTRYSKAIIARPLALCNVEEDSDENKNAVTSRVESFFP